MPGILRSALGLLRGSPAGTNPAVFEAMLEAGTGLDEIEPGLARKVARFVAAGEDEPVLLTIDRHAPACASALGLTEFWNLKVMQRAAWRSLLGADAKWDPVVVLRLAHVFGATGKVFQGNPWGLCGSTAGLLWLRLLVSFAAIVTGSANARGSEVEGIFGVLTVARCRELLDLAEEPEDGLVDLLFHALDYRHESLVDSLPGARAYLEENADTVMAAASGLDAAGRVQLVRSVGRFGQTDAYFDYVYACALDSAKSVREAARAALHEADDDRLVAAAARTFEEGSAALRARLPELLASALGAGARPLLESEEKRQNAKRVRESLKTALANIDLLAGSAPAAEAGPDALVALDGSVIEIPPAPASPADVELPDRLFDPLREAAASFSAALREVRAANRAEKYHWSQHWDPVTDADVAGFRQLVNGGPPPKGRRQREEFLWALHSSHCPCKFDRSGVDRFYASPELSERHLVRINAMVYRGRRWSVIEALGYAHDPATELIRRRIADGLDVRVVARLWSELHEREPLRSYLESEWGASLDGVPGDGLWMLAAEHLDLIDEAMGLRAQSGESPLVPAAALELLALFPKVPGRYLQALMTLATGTVKATREPARRLLATAPHIDDRIAGLLADGKQDVRAGAAEWLADREATGQVPALEEALARERSEIAKAAELTAMERLGADITPYFDPATLLAEARKGLGKALPKALEWFPFEALPALRWRDGEALEPDIVRWWVVLANKLKQPGGNALLDLQLARLDPEDASRLGLFVLRAWVSHDSRQMSEAEANAYAKAHADSAYQQYKKWIPEITPERVFAELKSQKASEYLGSAIANKGLLGLVAFADGAEAAGAVQSYLKQHGGRTAQCKAVIESLAANPAPAAIQVVLATANRFKARTVQSHAQSLIELIAERRGWSAEQLADRTMPTGGLDEQGRMALDCGGDRIYTVVYDEENRLVLENPAGKVVKALPGARSDEEQTLVKAAKRALSAARKEVKQATTMQRERLFEAMCLERTWDGEEWRRFVAAHPIVGRMCQRLVWLALGPDDQIRASFRPLEDGTFSDREDQEVAPASLARVRLAHRTLLDADGCAGWLEHFADYEVTALFDQFTRPMLTLDAADEREAIEDREGHMIESFVLRGAATKLGYQRGEAMDGGVVTEYVRRYETAGVVAVISFTGSPLPEENIPCALLRLEFHTLERGGYYWGRLVPPAGVSPVLLSETWNDLHAIAAAGTGFDDDWKKKAAFW